MATKQQALRVAAKFGFILDEVNSGSIGTNYALTFDHPTHSIGADCRSIHISDYGNANQSAASCAWQEAVERMEAEGPLLEKCQLDDCEYHGDGEF